MSSILLSWKIADLKHIEHVEFFPETLGQPPSFWSSSVTDENGPLNTDQAVGSSDTNSCAVIIAHLAFLFEEKNSLKNKHGTEYQNQISDTRRRWWLLPSSITAVGDITYANPSWDVFSCGAGSLAEVLCIRQAGFNCLQRVPGKELVNSCAQKRS